MKHGDVGVYQIPFPFVVGKIGAGSHHLALSRVRDDGQARRDPEQAGAPAVDEGDEQEEEDGVLQAGEDVEADAAARVGK